MKLISTFLILLIPFFSFAEIEFIHSYKKALKLAKEQDKLVFMDFTAKWCGPCKSLDKNTFALDSIGDFFNESFINLKVDSDHRKNIFKKYGVRGMPTLLFVDGDGKVFSKMVFRDPSRFMQYSRIVFNNYNSIASALAEISAVSDYNSIDSLLSKWALILSQESAIKCVNKVHDISDTHRAFVQKNYLTLLDEERFGETKDNIDPSLLTSDEVRDILAYRIYTGNGPPELKSISKIVKSIKGQGFLNVKETQAYLAINHYLYFDFSNCD